MQNTMVGDISNHDDDEQVNEVHKNLTTEK